MSEKVNSLVKNIFENILELNKIEPNYTWRNYLGDYGEYVAIKKYDLIKAPTNTKILMLLLKMVRKFKLNR